MIESLTQPHSQVTEKIADSQRKKKKTVKEETRMPQIPKKVYIFKKLSNSFTK